MDIGFLNTLSELLYEWVLDTSHEDYVLIFANHPDGGYGMTYLFLFLLLAGIIAPLIFYFYLAKNASQATKKNYLTTWGLGYFCLLVMNYVGLLSLTDSSEVFFNFDMLKVAFVDFFYYSLLMQLVSWLVKEKTMARNIDLYSCIFNK